MSQTVSAAAMAFGHGIQDAAKIMGIVVLALVVGGYQDTFTIPVWVYFMTAAFLSAGTYAGGWRIMRTLGRRIIHVTPPQGFAAETTAASILYIAGVWFKLPVSTTFTITGSIMGVGATKRLSAVRWGVAGNIVDRLGADVPRRGPDRRRDLRGGQSARRLSSGPAQPKRPVM